MLAQIIRWGSPAWTPYRLPASKQGLWWDALSSTWGTNGGITVATGVSSWRDNFLGRGAAQATGSLQPALAASSLGYNCPTGDGLDDTLTFAATGLPSGAAEGDLYVLARQDALAADTTTRTAASYGGNSNSPSNRRSADRTVVTGVNRGEAGVGDGASVAKFVVDPNVDLSGWHLMRARFQATTTYISVDGGPETSLAVVPAAALTRGRLFASHAITSSAFWAGAIASVFWSFAALSDAETSQVTNYFMRRKG